MKKFLLTAAMILSANMALASVTADQLVAAFQAKGYTNIEVTTGPTQIKVEASLDNTRHDVVYDIVTGAVLHQEQSSSAQIRARHRVEVKMAQRDFLNDPSNDDSANDDSALDQSGQDNQSDQAENGETEHSGHDAGESGHDSSGGSSGGSAGDSSGGSSHSGSGENG